MAFCFPFLMNNPWILFLVYVLLIYLIYRIAVWYNKRADRLSYNVDYLFVENKMRCQKIKLHDIKRLKYTTDKASLFGLKFNKYRIEFIDEKLDSITFWSGGLLPGVHDFVSHLKRYSPETKIAFYSHVFDH